MLLSGCAIRIEETETGPLGGLGGILDRVDKLTGLGKLMTCWIG